MTDESTEPDGAGLVIGSQDYVEFKLNGWRMRFVAAGAALVLLALGLVVESLAFGALAVVVAALLLTEGWVRVTPLTLEHQASGGEVRVFPWSEITSVQRWPGGIRVVPRTGRPTLVGIIGLSRADSVRLEAEIRERVDRAQDGARLTHTLDRLLVHTGEAPWRRWLKMVLGVALIGGSPLVGNLATVSAAAAVSLIVLFGSIGTALWFLGRGPDTLHLTAGNLAYGNERKEAWRVSLDAIERVEVRGNRLEVHTSEGSVRAATLSAWSPEQAERDIVGPIREAVARRKAVEAQSGDLAKLTLLVGKVGSSE